MWSHWSPATGKTKANIQYCPLAQRVKLSRELAKRDTATLVLPGTHSKWVQLKDNAIVKFNTFMTGEFYALLRQHSLLARSLPEADGEVALADAGRAPKDHRMRLSRFKSQAQGLAGPQQMLLANHLIRRLRPKLFSKG